MKKILLLLLLVFTLTINKSKAITVPSISAESYILYDMNKNKTILEKNSNKKMLTASISKLMTAIIAIENMPLDKEVKILKEDLLMEGSKAYILEGETVKLKDLIYGLLLRSGNDCANAISRVVFSSKKQFIESMNNLAKKLEMKNSVFNNPSGLDENLSNYSSAFDMALLMTYCFKNKEFRKINNTINYQFKSDKTSYTFRNKHRLINKNTIYNGGKTGFTKKAGRTLVTVASKKNLNLVVVTFKDPNDFIDHSNLFTYGFNNYQTKVIYKKQVIDKNFFNKNYLGYLKEDIMIYFDNDDLSDYFLVFYFYDKLKDDDIIGEVQIYYKNRLQFIENIYLYDPLSKNNEAFFIVLWRYFYD